MPETDHTQESAAGSVRRASAGKAARDDAAGSTMGEIGDRAKRASEHIAHAATRASEDLAAHVADQARSVAEDTISARKMRTERFIGSIRSAIEAGSDSLERDGLKTTANYTRQAADVIERLVQKVDDVDVRSVTSRVGTFVRARPVASFGAALLIGLAAYRVLRPRPRTTPKRPSGSEAN